MRKLVLVFVIAVCCFYANAQEYFFCEEFTVLNLTKDESETRDCSIIISGDSVAMLQIFDMPVKVPIERVKRVCGRTKYKGDDGVVYRDKICGRVFYFDKVSYVFIGKINRKHICMISLESESSYMFINSEYLLENGYIFK